MRAETPQHHEPNDMLDLPASSGMGTIADADMLAGWIDGSSAPCPPHIEAAMAHDPALRSLVRDLRLQQFKPESASAALHERLISLPMGPSVLARIGGWSIAAAAAVALAVLGLQLGAGNASEGQWNPSSDLAAMGLTTQADDDVLIAMLLPNEENPS